MNSYNMFLRVMDDKHLNVPDGTSEDPFFDDESDFVPHFQRVSISGEDKSGVSILILFKAFRFILC